MRKLMLGSLKVVCFICFLLMYTATERQYFQVALNYSWVEARNHCQVCFKEMVTLTPENHLNITGMIEAKHWTGLRKYINYNESMENITSTPITSTSSYDPYDELDFNSTNTSTRNFGTPWTRWANGDPLIFQNWHPGFPVFEWPLPKMDCCSCSCTCPVEERPTTRPTTRYTTQMPSSSSAGAGSSIMTSENGRRSIKNSTATSFVTVTTQTIDPDFNVTDNTTALDFNVTDNTTALDFNVTDNTTALDFNVTDNTTALDFNATDYTTDSIPNTTMITNQTYGRRTQDVTGVTSQHFPTTTSLFGHRPTDSLWTTTTAPPIVSTCEREPQEPPIIPENNKNYIENSCVAMLSFGPWVEEHCFKLLPFICYEEKFMGHVTVLNITSSEAFLSWDEGPGDISHYRLEMQGDTNWTIIKTDLMHQLNNLTAGTEYKIKVFPVKCERDLNSLKKSFYTIPNKVTNLDVTGVTETSVSLTWTKPTGNFDLYSVNTENVEKTIQKESIDFGNLIQGTCYTFVVRTGVKSKSSWSKESTVNACTKPGKVSNLKATQKVDEDMVLEWDPPEGNYTGFRVIALDKFKQKHSDQNLSNTQTSLNVINLPSGNIITLFVSAVANGSIEGDSSNITKLTAPGEIENLTVSPEDTSVTAQWDFNKINGNISSFKVALYYDSKEEKVNYPNITNTTFTGLKTAANYIIGVRAKNDDLLSNEINETFVTHPKSPKNPTVVEATTNSLKFKWDPPENVGVTDYIVNITSEFYNDVQKKTITEETNCTFDGLKSGTLYTFSVAIQTKDEMSDAVNCYAKTEPKPVEVGLSMLCASNQPLLCLASNQPEHIENQMKKYFEGVFGNNVNYTVKMKN